MTAGSEPLPLPVVPHDPEIVAGPEIASLPTVWSPPLAATASDETVNTVAGSGLSRLASIAAVNRTVDLPPTLAAASDTEQRKDTLRELDDLAAAFAQRQIDYAVADMRRQERAESKRPRPSSASRPSRGRPGRARAMIAGEAAQRVHFSDAPEHPRGRVGELPLLLEAIPERCEWQRPVSPRASVSIRVMLRVAIAAWIGAGGLAFLSYMQHPTRLAATPAAEPAGAIDTTALSLSE